MDAATGAQRVPLGPIRPPVNVATSVTATAVASKGPLRPQRPPVIRQSETAPELHKPEPVAEVEKDEPEAAEDSMEVEEEEAVQEAAEPPASNEAKEPDAKAEDDEDVPVQHIWPEMSPRAAEKYKSEIEHIQKTFHDEVDMFDTTMVSEYADEIFEYMSKLEVSLTKLESMPRLTRYVLARHDAEPRVHPWPN